MKVLVKSIIITGLFILSSVAILFGVEANESDSSLQFIDNVGTSDEMPIEEGDLNQQIDLANEEIMSETNLDTETSIDISEQIDATESSLVDTFKDDEEAMKLANPSLVDESNITASDKNLNEYVTPEVIDTTVISANNTGDLGPIPLPERANISSDQLLYENEEQIAYPSDVNKDKLKNLEDINSSAEYVSDVRDTPVVDDSVNRLGRNISAQSKKDYYSTGNTKKVLKNIEEGDKYFKEGDYEKSLKHYSEVVDLYDQFFNLEDDPLYSVALFGRGNSYYKLGRYHDALFDYNKFVDLNPFYVDAYGNRGNAEFKIGAYKDAIEDYNRVIEMNGSLLAAYVGRGNALLENDQPQLAIASYNAAQSISPRNKQVVYNKGVAYYSLQQQPLAIEYFTKSIKNNYRVSDSYNGLGNAYMSLGDHDEALKYYDRALAIDKKNVDAYLNRGAAYIELNEYYAAEKNFGQAMRNLPNNYRVYYGFGNLSIRINQYEKALEYLDKSIELNSGYPPAYELRAQTKEKLELSEEAEADRQIYLQLKEKLNR